MLFKWIVQKLCEMEILSSKLLTVPVNFEIDWIWHCLNKLMTREGKEGRVISCPNMGPRRRLAVLTQINSQLATPLRVAPVLLSPFFEKVFQMIPDF